MSYLKQSKTFVLCLGVLAMIFVLNYLVLAWTEPAQSPPAGNISAPLNVGNTGQLKSGGLILNTGNATTGLVVANGNVGIGTIIPGGKLEVSGTGNVILNSSGNVAIGKTSPNYKLDVNGMVGVNNNRITGVATPVDSTDAVNKGYVDAVSGGSAYTSCIMLKYQSNQTCPAGYKTIFKGYCDGSGNLSVYVDPEFPISTICRRPWRDPYTAAVEVSSLMSSYLWFFHKINPSINAFQVGLVNWTHDYAESYSADNTCTLTQTNTTCAGIAPSPTYGTGWEFLFNPNDYDSGYNDIHYIAMRYICRGCPPLYYAVRTDLFCCK
jgi:hypothetical protein